MDGVTIHEVLGKTRIDSVVTLGVLLRLQVEEIQTVSRIEKVGKSRGIRFISSVDVVDIEVQGIVNTHILIEEGRSNLELGRVDGLLGLGSNL